jgi:hypothetical protein
MKDIAARKESQRYPEPGEDAAEGIADGGEDGVGGVASADVEVFEVVTAQVTR